MANSSIKLSCRCSGILGTLKAPLRARRVICTCKDCRDFLNFLGRGDELLDVYGGTDIIQTAPSFISVDEGHAHLKALRLSSKGLMRWYCGRCKTPWGNCLANPKVPFIGLPIIGLISPEHQAQLPQNPYYVSPKSALKPPPRPSGPARSAIAMTGAILRLLRDKLAGRDTPHPFTTPQGQWITDPGTVYRTQLEED